jgi:hypothetical protein
MREKVTEGRKPPCNKELHDLYFSSNIVKVTVQRWVGWNG